MGTLILFCACRQGFYCYVNAASHSPSMLTCAPQGSAVGHVVRDRNKLCLDTGKAGDYLLLNFVFITNFQRDKQR